jgi:hypothetical protein
MWVMFLDDGTKFMQAISDVSKVPYLHLQCGKLKKVAFPVLLHASEKKA